MNKKIIVLSLLLLIILILVVITKYSTQPKKNQDQRCQAAILLNQRGDSLKYSDPKAAMNNFDQALDLLNQCPTEDNSQKQTALAYIGKILIYTESGEYPLALRTDSVAMAIADKLDDKLIKAKLLLAKGVVQYRQGYLDQATLTYQSAMNAAVEGNDYKLQAKIFSNQAMISYNNGDIENTIDGFKKALEIGKKYKDAALMAGSYMNLAVAYNSQSENDSVIGYYENASKLFKIINDKNGEVLCYQNLGNLYYDYSDFKSAIENYQQSVNLAIKMDDQSNMAKGYHNLAEVYSHLGDHKKAIELLFTSIRIKEKLQDKLSLAKGYTGIGDLYFNQGEYEKSDYYYKKSLQLCNSLNAVSEIANNLSNIGNIYSLKNMRDSAIVCYKKALQLNKQKNNAFAISNLNIILGVEYTLNKEYTLAETNLDKALKEKLEMEDQEGVANAQLHLAELYYNQYISDKSIKSDILLKKGTLAGEEAYKIANILNTLPISRDASKILKSIYQKKGELPKALYYAEQYNLLSDSILNRAKIEALTFAEARWNIENKEKQIQQLEQDKKTQQALLEARNHETRQQKIIIIFAIIVILLTLLFIVFLIQYNRKRRTLLYQNQMTQLTQMKLKNIRNRMSPHFIFNMLSSVAHESEQVKEKIHNISMLLRETIENSERTAISLEEEISIVHRYVDLQRDKIPQPFQFNVQIDSTVNPKMLIPAMILQIPVENAIKHGLIPMEHGQSNLTIIAKHSEGTNRISIYDNGVGLSHSTPRTAGTGNGLKMVLQMIQIFNTNNKNKIEFTIAERKESGATPSGTMVQITIPQDYSYDISQLN